MGLRPAKCYRDVKQRPYTRQAVRVPDKNYIGGVPAVKTRQFNMGNNMIQFPVAISMVSDDLFIIRDNALEALRVAVARQLTKYFGKDGFYMRLFVYPHNILRENKVPTGNKADKIGDGMSHSFGRPIGRSVRVTPGKKIFSIYVQQESIEEGKLAVAKAIGKINGRVKIKVHPAEAYPIAKKIKRETLTDTVVTEKKEEAGKEATAAAGTTEAGKTADAGKAGATGKDAGGKTAAPAKEEKPKGKK